MKIAIISDIHGNYEALLSVNEDIQKAEVDKIICLGDFVGYGPQPEEVAQFLMENDIPCVWAITRMRLSILLLLFISVQTQCYLSRLQGI
jgi:3',5'-cyclic AMP phosphodiesterase CpdA